MIIFAAVKDNIILLSYMKNIKLFLLFTLVCAGNTLFSQSNESSITITADLDCFIKFDGKQVAKLNKNVPKNLPIDKGMHIIKAITLDGYYKIQREVEIRKQKEILILHLTEKIAGTIQNDKLLRKHDMVFVEGGPFKMGDNKGGGDRDEYAHQVTLNSYYISRFEITVEKYRQFVDETNYQTLAEATGWGAIWNGEKIAKEYGVNWRMNASNPKYPVSLISFNDALSYCNWLSEKEGFEKCYTIIDDTTVNYNHQANGYRLPTEAEWEFAARGGRKSKGYLYAGSNNPDEVAWTKDNVDFKLQNVGSKQSNELGLFDMSGNVSEWCWDYYGLEYYKSGEENNPIGPSEGKPRIMRGGGLYYPNRYNRVANRMNATVDEKGGIDGFRIVRNVN